MSAEIVRKSSAWCYTVVSLSGMKLNLKMYKSSHKSFEDGSILALVLYCFCFAFAVYMLAACIYIYVPDISISDEMLARAQARERHASDGIGGQRRRTIDGILSVIRRSEEENSNDLQPPEAEDDPPSYIEVCGDDQEEPSVRVSKLSIDSPPAYSDS